MGADFKMSIEQVQGKNPVTVIHLAGWLDAMSENKLVQAVQKEKDNGAEFMVFELSDMDTITSAGIRAMQRAYQILTPNRGASKIVHLKLCNAPAQIYQVLGNTGLLRNMPMYESLEDAIDSFQK